MVNEALARMQISNDNIADKKSKFSKKASSFENAPLAAPENESEDEVHYDQIDERFADDSHLFRMGSETSSSKSKMRFRRGTKEHQKFSESESDSSSSERQKTSDIFSKLGRKQLHKRPKKKRGMGIPVQPPAIPQDSLDSHLAYQKMRYNAGDIDNQFLDDGMGRGEANIPMVSEMVDLTELWRF